MEKKETYKPTNQDLDDAIVHCKEIIEKMDDRCLCKRDHEILLSLLEELKARREQ